jgi:hypothetical protein
MENLCKEVIDIDFQARRAGDYRYFTSQRIGATNAVDLASVGRSHHGEQHSIPKLDIAGKIAGKKKRLFRSAAAHERTVNRSLGRLTHAIFLPVIHPSEIFFQLPSTHKYLIPSSAIFERKP